MSPYFVIALVITFVISVTALLAAIWRSETTADSKIRQVQLDLVELHDLIDQQLASIKKLHARAATRESRERKLNGDPADPMARIDGETGEQWKARMGRTVTGITRRI